MPLTLQIVESNPNLASLLGWHLQQLRYVVFLSANLQQGKQVFLQQLPSLIVIDTDLSDGDGLDLCQWVFQYHRSMIFILSTRTSEVDIVKGLQSGADDYLKKPFGLQEFLARIETLTRRTRQEKSPVYLDYGTLKIDLVQRQVRFKAKPIDLSPQEFSLLYVLTQAEGKPLSRVELLQRAWPEEITNPRTVDTHILSLRKKLECDPQQPYLIQTVRNIGYRFNLEGLTTIPMPSTISHTPNLTSIKN